MHIALYPPIQWHTTREEQNTENRCQETSAWNQREGGQETQRGAVDQAKAPAQQDSATAQRLKLSFPRGGPDPPRRVPRKNPKPSERPALHYSCPACGLCSRRKWQNQTSVLIRIQGTSSHLQTYPHKPRRDGIHQHRRPEAALQSNKRRRGTGDLVHSSVHLFY